MASRWIGIIAAALVICAAAPGARADGAPDGAPKLVRRSGRPSLPDSPAGRRAAEWLRAFNTGNPDSMAAFWKTNLAASVKDHPPLDRRREMYEHIWSEQGHLDVHRILDMGGDEIVLTVRNASGEWFEVGVHVEAAPPYGLMGVRFEDADPPGDGPPPEAKPLLSGQPLRDSIEALVTRRLADDSFSGVVLVERGGKTELLEAWGLSDRGSKTPNRVDTKFNIGSLNKLFTKTAIGQLAQQGQLALSDPLSKYLPGFNPEIARRITIEQILNHRSGLGDIFGERYDRMDRSKLRSNADFIPLFEDQPLQFEPGTAQRYSNAGYVLLGAVIERLTGRSYYDYVRENVFRPAGMTDSDSYLTGEGTPNLASGYTREIGDGPRAKRAWQNNASTRPARGSSAGGGYSTAADLARFAQALRTSKLLQPGWSRWVIGGPPPTADAVQAKAGPFGGIGAGGGAPGLNAALEIENDMTLVVLSNLDPPSAESLAQEIRGWLGGGGGGGRRVIVNHGGGQP